jgi:hypothetical protein
MEEAMVAANLKAEVVADQAINIKIPEPLKIKIQGLFLGKIIF